MKSKISQILFIISIVLNVFLIIFVVTTLNQNEKLKANDVKDLSMNNYILYNGFLLDISKKIQNPSDMMRDTYREDEFNGLYYNYLDGKFSGKTIGFTEEVYEDSFYVSNVGKYAFTNSYNAIPRQVNKFGAVDNKVLEKNSELMAYSDNWSEVVTDLDNDGKEEFIICVCDPEKAYSRVELYDSEGNRVDTLLFITDAYWGKIRQEGYKQFITIDGIEALDIDKDGIMEILIETPAYMGKMVSIYKYDGKKVIGDVNADLSIYLKS